MPAKKSRRFSSLGGDLKLGGALGKVGEMDNTGGGEPDTVSYTHLTLPTKA